MDKLKTLPGIFPTHNPSPIGHPHTHPSTAVISSSLPNTRPQAPPPLPLPQPQNRIYIIFMNTNNAWQCSGSVILNNGSTDPGSVGNIRILASLSTIKKFKASLDTGILSTVMIYYLPLCIFLSMAPKNVQVGSGSGSFSNWSPRIIIHNSGLRIRGPKSEFVGENIY
jgi:hypothetical protein